MSVKIRLRRMGTTNRAFYRVVAVNSTEGSAGKYLENLGYYNPRHPKGEAVIKLDRVDYWKGVGALMSDAVRALLKRAKPYVSTTAEKAAMAEAGVSEAKK
jgi:small subunit ribosomal protein S16